LDVARDFLGCRPFFLDGRCNAGRDLIDLADDPGNLVDCGNGTAR